MKLSPRWRCWKLSTACRRSPKVIFWGEGEGDRGHAAAGRGGPARRAACDGGHTKSGGGCPGCGVRHACVSTRYGFPTPSPPSPAVRPRTGCTAAAPPDRVAAGGATPGLGGRMAAEEIARVARARREAMLRAYRHMLRREDLEDCLSQAVCELLARGQRFANRA